MVREAEEHADEDKKRREAADNRNLAENLAYSTEKLVADNDDKLPEDVNTEVSADVEAVKEALKGDDDDAVKSAVEKLSMESQEMGKAIYEADAAAGATQADAPEEGEDVVDAEVVDDENADNSGEKKDGEDK